jgi:cytochrome d ubiquinol oxidase subunit II
VMSTLFIPLCLAALGIVLRGTGFAFQEVAPQLTGRSLSERLFAASSVITPFFMGTVIGAIASGRVPLGNAAGNPVTSWINPVSVLIGVLFVATGAYLSAVFLISDARRAGDADIERYFADRAVIAAVAAGVVAVVGIFVLRADASYVYDGLTSDGLPLVILSGACGAAALLLLRRGARRGIRPLAVGAVVAIIWGWGVAQHPYLLPTELTISAGAGTGPTLTMVIIVFAAAVVLVLPSIGFLYTLTQRNLLDSHREPENREAGGR